MRSGVGAFWLDSRLEWCFLVFFLDEVVDLEEVEEDELDCCGAGALGCAAGASSQAQEKARAMANQCVELWPLARRIWVLSRKRGIAQEANAEAAANEATQTDPTQDERRGHGQGIAEGRGVTACPYGWKVGTVRMSTGAS